MTQRAVFSFDLGKVKNEAVLAALKPEVARELPRARARVWQQDSLLYLEVKAEDSASLRAAVNSYLRWVKVAAEAAEAGARAYARENGVGPAPKAAATKKGAPKAPPKRKTPARKARK
jgi:KEOPS complex subunit Pcc1